VSDGVLRFTLRELQRTMASPVTLTILGVVGVVLGISGPFGTLEVMPLGGRLAFWLAIAYATFAAGDLGGSLASRIVGDRVPQWAHVPIQGIAGGIPVWLVVMGINALAFGATEELGLAAVDLLIVCIVIASGVVLGFMVFEHHGRRREDGTGTTEPPAIMRRLDATRRGDLVSLSVQDHYVEVVTTRGRSLILMRLGDAISEAGDVPGAQVHRSHWVALAGAANVTRRGGRVFIKTSAGDTIPVSRTHQARAREAGLIA